MAIRALMLRKKIDDKKKELTKLEQSRSELDAEREEITKREDELEQSIEEAETDEEKETVEEAVEQLEEDQKTLEEKFDELNNTVKDLETEISELETELANVEGETTAPAEEPAPEEGAERTATPITHERTAKTMLKNKTLRSMTMEAREAFIQREDVQETLAQFREALGAQKRSITGGSYTIGVSILDLIRENVMEYSKLLKYINLKSAKGAGRFIVQGRAPEAIWTECCDALNEVDISFGQLELDCFKVAAYVGVCKATAEDSDINLLDAIADAVSQGLGIAIDKAIIYGTGNKMPTGVITAVAADQTIAATNLVEVASSAKGDDLFAAIIEAAGNANPDYARNELVWVLNNKTRTTLLANAVKVDASGAIVAGVNNKMPVVGGDIVVLSFIPDNNIVTGYFDLYAMLERAGITVERSDEVKFIEDQTVIKAKARMDGAPAIVDAFVGIGLGVAPSTEVEFAGAAEG